MFKCVPVTDSCERESENAQLRCLTSAFFVVVGFHCAPFVGARERRREVNRMLKFLARFRREEGQAMVEYALILALVSVVSILALTAIGTNVNAIFTAIEAALAAVPLP
jgi:pilus assembly protein Flp/PilA